MAIWKPTMALMAFSAAMTVFGVLMRHNGSCVVGGLAGLAAIGVAIAWAFQAARQE